MACTLALLEKCPGAWNREDVRGIVTAIFSQQLAKSILFEWGQNQCRFLAARRFRNDQILTSPHAEPRSRFVTRDG
jgi:hypothetical protein